MGRLDRLVIAGLGLIGGSIALAARRADPQLRLAGWDENEIVAGAIARGVIDEACRPSEAVAGDLLVIAAPPHASLFLLDALPAAPAGPIVTDVVSVKRLIVDAATARRLTFVGGHPMAGSEQRGLSSARADLFDGRRWFLVDVGAGDEVNDAVEAFVATLGARPEWIDAVEHDRLMAALSHLPQVAASALMTAAGRLAGASNLDLAGTGLRDTTRLASSSADMWSEIAAANAGELSRALGLFIEELERARRALDASDPLEPFFETARRWRSKL